MFHSVDKDKKGCDAGIRDEYEWWLGGKMIRWIIACDPATVPFTRRIDLAGGGQMARLSKKGWEAIIYKILPGFKAVRITTTRCGAVRFEGPDCVWVEATVSGVGGIGNLMRRMLNTR